MKKINEIKKRNCIKTADVLDKIKYKKGEITMSKQLVAYFSASGTTAAKAKALVAKKHISN